MLPITIPEVELYDEDKNEFITYGPKTLQLEHSLVSISKWESKWHKPFLDGKPKTFEESLDYVRFMTITQNVDPEIYRFLTDENIRKINAYIEDPMTATTFSNSNKKSGSREIITAEIIYYNMIALNIPFECQKWHLNRLITLIRVCDIKNKPSKKMSKGELMRRNTSLNAARRKLLHTKG